MKPHAVRIERTAKKYKAQLLLATLGAIAGVLVPFAGYPTVGIFGLLIPSLIWFGIVRALIWWDHG